MKRMLPPLNPLRMFEAAARHVSFTRAATELGVTQAAVSRQVAVLEGWLKVPLFERLHSELRLTEAGQRYLESVRTAFDVLDTSTRAARVDRSRKVLQIRACATFAKYWLAPRLPRFAEAHPDIEVSLTTTVLPTTFEGTALDAAVRFGDGNWAGVQAAKIFGDALAPVYSLKLLSGVQGLYRPEDVRNYTILQSRHRRRDWADWADYARVDMDLRSAVTLENSSLSYQAALEGRGIAMGQIRLLDSHLSAGELVMPLDEVLERPLGYHFVFPSDRRPEAKVTAFRDWIMDESSGVR
jgi:LysR family glycine cleavage system transcriptional activator